MTIPACHLTLKTHHAYIHVTEADEIYCFKYNGHQCEWNQFSDYDQLSDWMFQPLDQFKLRLVMQEE